MFDIMGVVGSYLGMVLIRVLRLIQGNAKTKNISLKLKKNQSCQPVHMCDIFSL